MSLVTKKGQVACHKLIMVTAIEMCHELYETMMTVNTWYDAWKKQNPGASAKAMQARFVRKNLVFVVPQARATLAGMLAMPIDPKQKEEIYEALLLDSTLTQGKARKSLIKI